MNMKWGFRFGNVMAGNNTFSLMIIWFDDEFQSVGSPHTIEWLQCIVN